MSDVQHSGPQLETLAQSLAGHAARPLPRLEEDSRSVRAVIDSMGEGLIAVNAEGNITAVNPSTLKALGYTEEELIGQWFTGVLQAVDQHRTPLDHLSRPIIRALTSGEAISDYIYYLSKDGNMIPVFVTVAPIIIDDTPSGAIELFRDITSEKQLDVAKDEFVSLASHQLRTPATGVKAILSMLMSGDFGELNDRQRYYLAKAIQSNDRQLHIIEDILNTAKIDSGQMDLQLERVDLVPLVGDAVAEHESQFKQRQQTITVECPTELHGWVDAQKMRMVLDNLLSNASKYTNEEGSIQVKAMQEQDRIKISIKDSGMGIPQAQMDRLFQKFSRIDNELSSVVGGTGLRLYLVKNIVALHRGEIMVESELEQGTVFHVILPVNLS